MTGCLVASSPREQGSERRKTFRHGCSDAPWSQLLASGGRSSGCGWGGWLWARVWEVRVSGPRGIRAQGEGAQGAARPRALFTGSTAALTKAANLVLRLTHVCYLPVLEARSPQWVSLGCSQGVGRAVSLREALGVGGIGLVLSSL